MSNMRDCQTKKSPGRIIWEGYMKINTGKYDSFREEGMSSLREGEWAVAESQRGMMQVKVKFVCQGATREKKGFFLEEGLKGWARYRKVSELLLSPKQGWPREWEEWLKYRRRK